MNPILHELQNKQWVWTAAHAKEHSPSKLLTTGFDALDQVLSGGFPRAGMIHIASYLGCGELRLMLAVLQQNQHHKRTVDENKLLIFINPPFELNAEFLVAHNISLSQLVVIHTHSDSNSALWSAEQSLKSGACSAVFMWQKQLKNTHIKKLELAALQGNSYCIWLDSYLHKQAISQHQNLPLSLSLSISRKNDDLAIRVNKQKVGWAQKSVTIPLPFVSQTYRARLKNLASQSMASNVVAINAKPSLMRK